ncbi:MAG TPA: hypothetical protein VGJ20_30930 [Xanthobacteraceae bacterium]|jgi:hypothetical protein
MDKKIAGLLGVAAAVGAVTGAQAAPAQRPQLAVPSSYKDLLEPVPNALALLKADDAARAQTGPAARVELVQYHHHHHHHHHNSFLPGVIGGVIGGLLAAPAPPPPPPGCYWTRGRPYWDGYRWVRPRVRICE